MEFSDSELNKGETLYNQGIRENAFIVINGINLEILRNQTITVYYKTDYNERIPVVTGSINLKLNSEFIQLIKLIVQDSEYLDYYGKSVDTTLAGFLKKSIDNVEINWYTYDGSFHSCGIDLLRFWGWNREKNNPYRKLSYKDSERFDPYLIKLYEMGIRDKTTIQINGYTTYIQYRC